MSRDATFHSSLSTDHSVLFLAGEYPPRPGGIGDYTALLAGHLAAQGVRVTVLASRDERVSAADAGDASPVGLLSTAASCGGEDARAPRLVVWRAVPCWDWRCARVVATAVRLARPDVVHLQYQPAAFGMEAAVSWLPGWLRQRLPGLRAVTTFHDLRVPYLFPKAGRLREAVRDRLVRGSDAAVFTDQDDWAAAGAVRRPGRYWIPIGSNLAVAPPAGYDRRRWRAQAGADDATFLVVHLGFLNRSKGLETLLDAVVRLRGEGRRVRLLLVGAEVGASDPANRAYAGELERRLGVLALSGLVERLPLVPPAIASAYLLAADAAAFPFRDGASLRRGSLLAALAHGLPTVSTRAPRARRDAPWNPATSLGFSPPSVALRDEETLLLVPPGDSAALAAALARLADDPALRARLAAGGQVLADALSWPRIAEAHRTLYAALLGDAPAVGSRRSGQALGAYQVV
jgi:glycosyltransferase involved in cell wall biosynthesis